MKFHTFCAEARHQRQPLRPVSLREWWQGYTELELARQRLELQQPCASLPQFSSFLSRLFSGRVLFTLNLLKGFGELPIPATEHFTGFI